MWNKLKGGRGITGKKGKGRQGTCAKDPWTKPKGERIECRRWDGWGRKSGGGKMESTVLEQR